MRFKVIARFCILLVLIAGAGASAQYREILLPYPDTTRFKVQFVDEMHGWVSNSSGAILHTTDGGATWSEHRFNGTNHLNDVQFVDTHNGWIYVRGPGRGLSRDTLFRTNNGGQTWEQRPFPDSTQVTGRPLHGYINEPYNIEIVDSNKVFFEGYRWERRSGIDYLITSWYLTTNGGSTWDSLQIPEHYPYVTDIMFVRNFSKWIRIDYGSALPNIPMFVKCYLSRDTGRTWTFVKSWFDVIGRSFIKSDSLHYIICNDSYREINSSHPGTFGTTNGGETWNTFPYYNIAKMGVMPQDTVLWLIDLGYSTSGPRYQETMDGYIVRVHPSLDGFVAYRRRYPDKARWLCNVGTKVYALTALGRLVVFDDLETNVQQQPAVEVSGIRLLAVHPNPFTSGYLSLEYENGRTEATGIFIYNSTGTMIRENISPGLNPAGRYAALIDLGTLPTGVYFLIVESLSSRAFGHFVVFR